ncbi:MAG: DUF6887 family protein [Waterburya sp.]
MTNSQLKQHLLKNRDDREALRELKRRPKKSAFVIPADATVQESDRILKNEIEKAI